MKQKLLLSLFIASIHLAVNAQKTTQKATTYAITGSEKGHNDWTEVRLVNPATGEELKTIYKNSEETKILNARTGKPVAKKDLKTETVQIKRLTPDGNVMTVSGDNVHIIRVRPGKPTEATALTADQMRDTRMLREERIERIIVEGRRSPQALEPTKLKEDIQESIKDKILIEKNARVVRVRPNVNVNTNTDVNTNVNVNSNVDVITNVNTNTNIVTKKNITIIKNIDGKIRTEVIMRLNPSLDKPFSTYSAACAYDKKHERLYYTPMGIAQLRYIDLKSKTPQVYYFEDEQFGALRHRGDVANQITRMVIGADGNGYALTNNAEHLIKFTTNKKATITDLGALTDDVSNGKYSVHSSTGYGGDIIAAKTGELYLITANRNVFKIDIKTMVATYTGTIQGLPRGYSTNGAAVEGGTMVLVNSSNSTQGYYHFDINKLVAEKVSTSSDVYNASDLANANLLTVKKEKEEEQPKEEIVPDAVVEKSTFKNKQIADEAAPQAKLGVYPNPVTNGIVNLLLDNYAAGRYQAKLIDVSGKQLTTKSFVIGSKNHTEPFNLPGSIARGNYLIQLFDQSTKNAGVVKLVIQ